MKTARGIALAAAVAGAAMMAACDCPPFTECDYWPPEVALGEDEARAVLSGLIEMANEATHGTHTYACPFGGEATNTVTVTSGQLGDSGLYRYGTWELRPSGCGLAVGYPDLAIDGRVAFAARAVIFDSGRRRLKAWVEGGFGWSTPHEDEVEFLGCSSEGLTKTFWKEAGDDDPFNESLVGYFCEASVEIPLESFPGAELGTS